MSKMVIKKLRISVLVGLVMAIILSAVNFEANCEELRDNILRLHIMANSDSDADQKLKLKIRDEILSVIGDGFEKCHNLVQAEKFAKENLQLVKAIAKKVIKENGYDYSVDVSIGKTYFETREYETFTLPAGYYDSVIVKIGEAKGKNWWCVMFPSLCVASSNAKLKDTVNKGADRIATKPQKYKIRFKTIEFYEYLKKIF